MLEYLHPSTHHPGKIRQNTFIGKYRTLKTRPTIVVPVFVAFGIERPVCSRRALVRAAIEAGIFNDLGSGSNVDICVIKKDGAQLTRSDAVYNTRPYRRATSYKFPRGVTRAFEHR